MSNLLQVTKNYNNPYEAAYNALKRNPWFNQSDWDVHAKRGRLDDYITLIEEANDKLDYDKFSGQYLFDRLNTDERFSITANELLSDRITNKTRTENFFNEETGKEDSRTFEMTDYDYTKYLINSRLKEEYEKINREREQERKDSMNGFLKALANSASVVLEPVKGVMDFTNDMISIVEGVTDGFTSVAKGNKFSDGFREAFNTNKWGGADWRIFDNAGLTDGIVEFEKKYSDFRDLDGNYTNLGKYLGGVGYSLGKAIPSMALNLVTVGVAGAGSKTASTTAKVATALYYTGMGADTFRELASDPSLASVPTYKLMLNASVKTVVEFAIQKGVSIAFGPTQLDALIFGETSKSIGKISTLNAVKKFAMDALSEGTEEFIQQFSNYVVDRYMMAKQHEFANVTVWTGQTAVDAFILGSLSVVGTNLLSITKSGVKDTIIQRKLDQIAKGKEFTAEQLSKIKSQYNPFIEKKNVLASWQFKNNVSDLMSEYNRLIKDTTLSNEQKNNAVGQMYAIARTMASVYSEIGDTRFKNAMDLIEGMKSLDNKFNVTDDYALKMAENIVHNADTVMSDAFVKKIKDAGMTEISAIIERGMDDAVIPDDIKGQALETVKQILKDDDDVAKVVFTKDGTTIVSTPTAKFIPIKYAKVASKDAISQHIAEADLINNVQNSSLMKPMLTEIKKTFEFVSGRKDVSTEEVISNLFFNKTFQEILLYTANSDMLNLISNLKEIEKAATSKSVKDATYKNKINAIIKILNFKVFEYCIYQQNIDLALVKNILSDSQINKVRELRYSRDLKNRAIKGEKLLDNEKRMLENRVNAIATTQDIKEDIVANLFSDNRAARTSAFSVMERYYKDIFNSPYNGKTYLESNTIPNVLFNQMLKDYELTVDTLLKPVSDKDLYNSIFEKYGIVNAENTLKFYQDKFQEYTGKHYSFSYKNGKVKIYEHIAVETGYDVYNAARPEILTGKDIEHRTFTTVRTDKTKLFSNIVSKTLDPVSKKLVSIKDAVYDPRLLNNTIKQAIIERYGALSPTNTFLYLRQYFIEKTGTTTIVVMNDGSFQFADVRPMLNVLMNTDIDNSLVTENCKVGKFVKSEYLVGRLKDTSVKLGTETKYNSVSNTITIDRNFSKIPANFRFALLHEFQHAVQIENGMNGGLRQDFMSALSPNKQLDLVKEVKSHKPELFENVKVTSRDALRITEQFIYDTTGESMAYGVDTNNVVVDFYPTVVSNFNDKTEIITPWGTKYKLNENIKTQSLIITDDNKNEFSKVSKLAMNELMPYDPNHIRKGFILPDGNVGFMNNGEIHSSIIDDVIIQSDDYFVAAAYMNDAIQITTDETSIYEGKRIAKFGNSTYTVRMISYANYLQKQSLEYFIDRALSDGHTVLLADAFGFALTSSDNLNLGWEITAQDLIKQYGKDFALNRAYKQTIDSVNYTQNFYGDHYFWYKKEFIKYYNNDSYDSNQCYGIIFLDGTVKFSSNIKNNKYYVRNSVKESLKQRGVNVKSDSIGFAEAISMSSATITTSKNLVTITLPDYTTVGQRKSLFKLFKSILDNGKSISVNFLNNTKQFNSNDFDSIFEFSANVLASINSQYFTDIPSYINEEMSMAQPGDRRFVAQKDAANTNLQYFVKKNRQIQLDKSLQKFIVDADASQLDEDLWNMIGGEEKGTLTKRKLNEYIRTSENIGDYTFDLIKKCFFPDCPIKSFEQLQYMVNKNAAEYYALYAIMRELNATNDVLNKKISYKSFNEILTRLKNMPDLANKFEKLVLRFETYKDSQVDIDYDNLKFVFLKYFDGSVSSAAHAASIAKMLARTGWKTPGKVATESLDREVKGDLTYSEILADDNIQDALEQILSNSGRTEKEDAVLQYRFSKLYDEIQSGNKKYTKQELNSIMLKYRQKVEDLSDDDLNQQFIKINSAEDMGVSLSDEILTSKKQVVRPRVNIAAQIKRFASTIRNNLTKNDKKRFLETHNDIFDDELKVKTELYEGKSREHLLELEDELREISKDVRAGIYRSKEMVNIKKQLEKTRKKLENEKLKKAKSLAGEQIGKPVIIAEREFYIESTTNIPPELKTILSTTFKKFVDTDVSYLTKEGEKHMQMNLKKFIEDNALSLSSLSKESVIDIINFYKNSFLTGSITDASYKKYNAFKLYVLGYIYDQARSGNWQLSAEHFKTMEDVMSTTASNAGTELSVFKSILPIINPNKLIIQSFAKTTGIEFLETDIDELSSAIQTGNVKTIEKSMNNLYDRGIKLQKNGKASFLEKLWRFQRLCMLSSPGTSIRNAVSNALVTVGNNTSSAIGNLFLKNTRRKNQYVISGTKVSSDTAKFIKENFVDNGLLQLISDGLSKYDVRQAEGKFITSDKMMVSLVVESIKNKIFMHKNEFDSKLLNGFDKIVFKMLSDDPFISRRALSYFGKMLTEDNTNLKMSTSLKMSTKILETFAEAYTLAAWDYMRKPNFFNSIEQGIKRRGGDAAWFAYKQLLPFASASWNWFVEGLNYTPVGLIKGIINFTKLENTIDKMERDRQLGEQTPSARFAEYLARRNIGKGILGSIGLGIGLLLGGTGVAGIDEEDKKVKLRIGDIKVDISGLFGTHSILIGIAMTNPEKGDWQNYMYNVMETLFNDSTLQDMFNSFRYSDTFGEWLINEPSQMLSMYVPNFIKAFNRLLYNHKVKYSQGILGGFEAFAVQSIPGFAYAMPKRIDPYTGEVQSKYSIPFLFQFINGISPVDFAAYKVSDLEKQAIAIGLKKSELTGKYEDIGELSNEDKQKLNELYGKLNNKTLTEFFNNEAEYKVQTENGTYKTLTYSEMTMEQQATVANRIMSNNAKYAKISVYVSNGGKYYATNEEFKTLTSLGIVDNVFKETNKLKGFN